MLSASRYSLASVKEINYSITRKSSKAECRISLIKAQSKYWQHQHFCFLVSFLALPLAACRHRVSSHRDSARGSPVVTCVTWSGPGSWALYTAAVQLAGSAAYPGCLFQHLVSQCPQMESRTCRAGAYRHREIHGDWSPIPGRERKGSRGCSVSLGAGLCCPSAQPLPTLDSPTTFEEDPAT